MIFSVCASPADALLESDRNCVRIRSYFKISFAIPKQADTLATLLIYFVPKILGKSKNEDSRRGSTFVTMDFQHVWRSGEDDT
ncbi:MAG: hypothetical protein SGARI_005113, partial [Bacillariaceae sp.]